MWGLFISDVRIKELHTEAGSWAMLGRRTEVVMRGKLHEANACAHGVWISHALLHAIAEGTNTDTAAVAEPPTPVTWRCVSQADILSV